MEYLHDKARILVTHQIQFLRNAHKIMVMKDGKCIALGSYEELIKAGINIMTYVTEMKTKEIKNDITDSKKDLLRHRTISVSSSIASSIGNSDGDPTENRDISDEEDPKVKQENKEIGSIDSSIYMEYFKAGAGPFLMFITISTIFISQALYQGSDYWLTYW